MTSIEGIALMVIGGLVIVGVFSYLASRDLRKKQQRSK
jgi:hypothetical protein